MAKKKRKKTLFSSVLEAIERKKKAVKKAGKNGYKGRELKHTTDVKG